MKHILLIALLFGVAPVTSAQTANTGAGECKLTLSRVPAIRGIRLGMTLDQVVALFPGAEDDKELRAKLYQTHFGLQSSFISPSKYGSKENFAGVTLVYLGFLDGQLDLFTIHYDGPEWNSDVQFASVVAEALKLPGVEFWKPVTGGLGITCDGFEVTLSRAGPMIGMRNLQVDIDKIVRGREEERKERARRAFKP